MQIIVSPKQLGAAFVIGALTGAAIVGVTLTYRAQASPQGAGGGFTYYVGPIGKPEGPKGFSLGVTHIAERAGEVVRCEPTTTERGQW